MRALRFHAAKDLRIDDIAAPPAHPPAGQVVIRNRFVGICGTDLHATRDPDRLVEVTECP
jgi:(R,R)-butanediol dehydrogenase/meso-butanediol dehydrogenase/diacetyl reductase